MSATGGGPGEPFEREMERAFRSGTFVSRGQSAEFVRDLARLAERIGALMATEPARAAALHETLLACCAEKAGEVDDSIGVFSDFAVDVVRGWVRARQAAEADPAGTAVRLADWMEVDRHGFFVRIERAIAPEFDAPGLSAFTAEVRRRFDRAGDAKDADSPDHRRRSWGEALRVLLRAGGDADAYAAFAAETGLSPADCHAVAALHAGADRLAEALAWVERGLGLCGPRGTSPAEYDLVKLRRGVLLRLGRRDEVVAEAWDDYAAWPHKYRLLTLLELVPSEERAAFRARAAEKAGEARLDHRMEIYLELDEAGRLSDLVAGTSDAALEGLSHTLTGPAARRLAKERPDLAARLWCARGMRVVEAGKSKYYDEALEDLRGARSCFLEAGRAEDWEALVRRVRADHRRKVGFMAGFERVAAGEERVPELSFVTRARARFAGRRGPDGG